MKKPIIFVAIAISAVVIGVVGFFAWLIISDDSTPPKLPINSSPNTLTITSNGCCFWVEDVKVSLFYGNEQKETIFYQEKISEHDIFNKEIPDIENNPVSLLVEFKGFYRLNSAFSMQVLDFPNIEELKQSGVLLYFQEHDDMYLNVVAGTTHKSYKMGANENEWDLMDNPNKIYP